MCDICGDAGTARRVENVSDYVTGDRFSLSQCRRCGFARTDPIPASLDRYYADRYRRFSPLAAWVLRRLYLRRVDGWLSRLPARGRVLEIGSGTGWMLGAFRARGWAAIGSERSVASAAVSRHASGAAMFVGDLSAVRPGATCDLIVMFHVLEHLADPQQVLSEAAARLGPGGTLVLGVPNIASWQARAAGRHWLHLDVPRHLVHFTPDALERALRASGFRVTRIDFTSLEHDPLGWVQAGLSRLGFEEALILKVLIRMPRRSGPVATVAALLLAIPLGVVGLILAAASWRLGAGALMEVWATREV
ncbi:MAG TPA: class I SAM-dependent methyltransferase [Methylomirabilota bacterium]|nr:class I SAM-dependent methyltransferase [Methylomirabilota bacterium]